MRLNGGAETPNGAKNDATLSGFDAKCSIFKNLELASVFLDHENAPLKSIVYVSFGENIFIVLSSQGKYIFFRFAFQ